MKTIIEKLGIKPITPLIGKTPDGEDWEFSFHDVVRELEQQRNEMLEALIDDIKRALSNWEDNYEGGGDWEIECLKANIRKIKLIEKACYPKKWNEIKKL